MTEISHDIDPELVDDRDTEDSEDINFELPEYDGSQFVPSDDFEYFDEDGGDDDGSQDED